MSEWIEHDGMGCPFRNGVKIDAVMTDGQEFACWAIQNAGRPVGSPMNTWDFRSPALRHVERYRLSDADDKAKREARMAEFTRIAEEGLKTDVPVKAPQKVGADQ